MTMTNGPSDDYAVAGSDELDRTTTRYGWILAGAWTLVVLTILAWGWQREGERSSELALASAQLALAKDMTYRQWSSMHGGVYVPVTEQTPPNPYLSQIPERDITTPSGRRLTLINPAYMTRQVNELGNNLHGLAAHLTSLNPLRPENAPDPWEAEALKMFEEGLTEAHAEMQMDGQHYLRIILPFVTEESCLHCHAHQGYKLGDVRGGLSVSAPMGPYVKQMKAQFRSGLVRYGLMWLVGLAGVLLLTIRLIAARRQSGERRREILEALSVSESCHRSYLEFSPFGVFITNEKGQFVQVNPEACRMTGYTEQEILSMSIPDLLPESDREDGLAHFVRLIQTGKSTGELGLKPKTGPLRFWSIDAVKISETRFLGFAQDVTRKRELESKSRQQQRLEAVSTLASGMAHEINNPLNVIMNYGQLILDEKDSSDVVREFATYIIDESERVATIVRCLQDFSHQRNQTHRMERVEDLLTLVISLMGTALKKERVPIDTRVDEDVPAVLCSRPQIQQVITALLTNALDAVTQRYPGESDSKRILVDISRVWEDGKEWVRTRIEDPGNGMSDEVADHVFDPFYSTKPRHKGMGIGLSISFGIVKAHGGKLWFETEPGVGTKFYMDLRANPGPQPVDVGETGSPLRLV
jgi:PAS domain S-box-containing protein